MSTFFEESPDIIPASPDSAVKTKYDSTPLSRNKDFVLKNRPNRNKLANNLVSHKSSSGSSKFMSVPDSDEEVLILSSDASVSDDNEILEDSGDQSCILASDLETSQNSPHNVKKSKKSFIKETPSNFSCREKLHINNSSKCEIMSSTPTFDPSTPVGGWRAHRRDSLSDDESPIVKPVKDRRRAVIDSDSESDSTFYSPQRLSSQDKSKCVSEEHVDNISSGSSHLIGNTVDEEPKTPSVKHDALYQIEGRSNDKIFVSKSSSLSNTPCITSLNTNHDNIATDLNLHEESLSPSTSQCIETVDSPPKRNEDEKILGIYAGKYKIKSRSKEKGKLNSSNESDLHDASHSSANISTSSVSSTKSLNISNMSPAEIENKIKSNKMILKTANINALPDKGAKLKENINQLQEALVQLSIESIKEDESSESNKNKENKSINANSESSFGSIYSHKPNNSVLDTQYKTSDKSFGSPEIQVISEAKRDLTSDHIRQLKQQLRDKQMVYKATNPRALPDGGFKLQESIASLEKEIMMAEYKASIESKFKTSFESRQKIATDPDIIEETTAPQYSQTKVYNSALQLSSVAQAIGGKTRHHLPQHVLESLYNVDKDYGAKDYGGKLSEAREYNMIRMTSDAVQSLHKMLKLMPDVETVEDVQPQGLKVDLMPHQKRALAWLLWRESQAPPGGIFADDMGLGKTLTMLSVILRHKELVKSGEIVEDFSALGKRGEDDGDVSEEEEWLSKGKERRRKGRSGLTPSKGTLVVCPASLLGQWEGEVKKHLEKRKLSVLIYHGNSRDISLSRLSQYDLVVTTYQLVMREAFSAAVAKTLKKNVDAVPEIEAYNQGPLFRVGWTRIILDEAHQIRNHKSKTSQSACMLRGGRRWAVTGTPVQNKELDLYSLIRFLRVSPFDDYTCWKHQLKSSSAHGLRKLNLLVRALLLRRNKDQVDQNTGEALVHLPSKEVVQHKFSLQQEEREVYDRVFAFSRSSLIQYMKSQEEKEREKAEKLGQTFKPQYAFASTVEGNKYTPTLRGDILKAEELKAHHMLVLLLRLRQICCHPALIRSIIDEETKAADGLNAQPLKDDLEIDLITQMNEMSLREGVENEEIDNRVRDQILNGDNPVFKKRAKSSKIAKVIEQLSHLEGRESYEKAVIVSQWTSMLEIVYKHLKKNGFEATAITGQIPVKDRASIVEEFNAEGKGPRVLLLSLGAGGVGLNLVGANHLFLLDMHWNPQLESQACDRIYRVGQKRPVKIHRFVVENTVEEKILELQQKKIEMADAVLTGAKRNLANKLTLQDIQALFNVT